MAELYGKARSTINEHILNAYKEKEIEEAKTMRKIENSDFSTKPMLQWDRHDVIGGQARCNFYEEGELNEKAICRNFRHTTQHGAIEWKTQGYIV